MPAPSGNFLLCYFFPYELSFRHVGLKGQHDGFIKSVSIRVACIKGTLGCKGFRYVERLFVRKGQVAADVVAYDDHMIHIIEFTCPYDHLKEGNIEAMEEAYQDKVNKYRNLITQCRSQFNMQADLTIIVVSSLGAIYKKSIKELKKLLSLSSDRLKSKLNTLLRRMSIASCIGSYFIYYNIKFKENDLHRGLDDNDDNENTEVRGNSRNDEDTKQDETHAHEERNSVEDNNEHNDEGNSAESYVDDDEAEQSNEPEDEGETMFVAQRGYKNNEPTIMLPENEDTDADIEVTEQRNSCVRIPITLRSLNRNNTNYPTTVETQSLTQGSLQPRESTSDSLIESESRTQSETTCTENSTDPEGNTPDGDSASE